MKHKNKTALANAKGVELNVLNQTVKLVDGWLERNRRISWNSVQASLLWGSIIDIQLALLCDLPALLNPLFDYEKRTVFYLKENP